MNNLVAYAKLELKIATSLSFSLKTFNAFLYSSFFSLNIETSDSKDSTFNINRRYKDYQKKCSTRYVERSIIKHGWDSFQKIEILICDSDEKKLRAWEGFYIGLFGTYIKDNPEFGMNIVRNPKMAISKDPIVARKISKAQKGRVMPIEQRNKLSSVMKGVVHVGIKRPYLSERNKVVKPALGRVGDKHPMSKKVFCIFDNKTFDSIKDAGDYYGFTRQGMKYRIKTQPHNYKYI